MLDKSHLTSADRTIWRLRFRSARLYSRDGFTDQALEQAKMAWEPGTAEVPVAMFIVALQSNLGQREEALKLLSEVAPRISATDRQGQALLLEYQQALNSDHQQE